MRRTRQTLVTFALAMGAAVCCSGCLALMVPGLAYSGYKYEQNKNSPSTQSASNTQSSKPASTSTQQNTPDNSIE
jgi:hypothetical protein